MDAALMPLVLLPPLARFGAAAVMVTGPAGVRDRLRAAQDGRLGEGDAVALGADLDRLADLLAR